MALERRARPRLIDQLRLFDVFRPHFGEDGAKEAVDAFQDEFAPMATHDDIDNLKEWLRAEINGAVIKMLVGASVIAGIALAIAELT